MAHGKEEVFRAIVSTATESWRIGDRIMCTKSYTFPFNIPSFVLSAVFYLVFTSLVQRQEDGRFHKEV
ncbi:hypothetical protein ZHAS_00002570 [Anopheles sinensis]|uniref:Uncharacterized protein n=1 Tax=Anopheles sinensis TaxID=74873 RepID=A0A084VCH6_ANOSI|nr:hypothetical protein ZHAS_00002570 [Anopheles sinensis]